MRAAARRLVFGLATVTGFARRGWFIPYRHAPPPRRSGYLALEPLFAAAESSFLAVLGEIDSLSVDLGAIPNDGPSLRWRQSWFPPLDAAAAYALVRRERPGRIIEVGSGHSTRFLARAAADGRFKTSLTAIDPSPRASLTGLGVRHLPSTFEETDRSLFAPLQSGDVVFIDSSHVAMPGGDVETAFLDILPRLPTGILLHVHDVFLPDAYPAAWDWRGYNEQIVVGALIQGCGFDIVWSSRYVATRMADVLARGIVARLPRIDGACETSLWLRKR
jgi:hypothetical protein